MEKCYIVSVGEPWNYLGYDWNQHVFMDESEAEDYFDKVKEEKIQQTIDDNGMSEEEAEEYRQEIAENATYNYCDDPEGEWAVKIDEGTIGE